MRIAIIGRTQILFETARRLHTDGHELACIVTAPAAPEYTRTEADFEALARELGVPFACTSTLESETVRGMCAGADLGVSVNWVSIVSAETIGRFRIGVLNSHHGDLPRYRGNACSNWAILDGAPRVTNTVHLMESGVLDCGRVVGELHHDLDGAGTITDVYAWAERTTPGLFAECVARLAQDPDFALRIADPEDPEAFRCYPRRPEDAFIDWTRSPEEIHRLVRAAAAPFPGAYTYYRSDGGVRKLFVLRARIVADTDRDRAVPGHVLRNDPESGESFVRCGAGVLALQECREEGAGADDATFEPGRTWRSIRMRLGVRPEDWLWHMQESARG